MKSRPAGFAVCSDVSELSNRLHGRTPSRQPAGRRALQLQHLQHFAGFLRLYNRGSMKVRGPFWSGQSLVSGRLLPRPAPESCLPRRRRFSSNISKPKPPADPPPKQRHRLPGLPRQLRRKPHSRQSSRPPRANSNQQSRRQARIEAGPPRFRRRTPRRSLPPPSPRR